MKTAIVHEWLTVLAGSEKVLEAIYEIFPSPIFTLVKNEANLEDTIFADAEIHTSFVQKLPGARRKYKRYLPLFPLAVEQFDLTPFDVVISSSHSVAKGVLTNSQQTHICCCYTPMRYAWDLYQPYLKESGLQRGLKGKIAKLVLHYLRLWDVSAARRVDHFVAISRYVARRIRKTYGREATVIYPPVDVERFDLCSRKDDFYVTASRLVPYKRIDMIVEAFSHLRDRKLLVIGDGPDYRKIRAKAGPNVELLGYQPFSRLKECLENARAFVFAADEDFGILPVEAQSCGTPVIAYGRGGVLETVVPEETGVLYPEQTVESLVAAVRQFESRPDAFDPEAIRRQAERFNKERFQQEFHELVTRVAHGET